MTKPHEETWMATGEQVGWVDGPVPEFGDLRHAGEFVSPSSDDGEHRAKLAAQAPVMARVLLKVERAGRTNYVGDGGYDCCSCCGGIAPGQSTMMDAVDDLKTGKTVVGHYGDCELANALRAAGVRT
jgi:hypothetical protein